MADIRINWDAPIDKTVVDSISIYRYAGITEDCDTIRISGTLVAENLSADSTTYDDLGTPDHGHITYGIYSKNLTGFSPCAHAVIPLIPGSENAPSELTAVYINTVPEFGPTNFNSTLDLAPKYGIDTGNYVYPFFLTENEANFYDSFFGGNGSNHTMTYKSVTYYMPNSGGTHAGSEIPADIVINGNTFVYSKIDTGFDNTIPPSESPSDLSTITNPTESPTGLTSQEVITAPTESPSNLSTITNPTQSPNSLESTASPSVAPSDLDTTASPSEAPSDLSTTANPSEAPSNLSIITSPSEAPSNLTSTVEQSQGILPFRAREINAAGAGTVGDSYTKYYDSYSDGDTSVDFMWDSNNSSLEITASNTNGATETIYTHTGTFYNSTLGGGGTGYVSNENWYLGGFNDSISGNTTYYPDIRIIKRDGLTYSNLPDGSSFDLTFAFYNPNTY